MSTRELDWIDVEAIIGAAPDDAETMTCQICWLLVDTDWFTRRGHANWHVKHGDVAL